MSVARAATERPVTTWRSEQQARKMLTSLQRRVGLMPCPNFEPAADAIDCPNRSRSPNLCENPKFCLDFSLPGSCKVCASRNPMEPCVAPPVTIHMKRCPKTQRATSGYAWIVIRLRQWRRAQRVQTTALNAICRPSAWKVSPPSTITGSAFGTRRIRQSCSQRLIQRTDGNYWACLSSSATRRCNSRASSRFPADAAARANAPR